MAAKSSFLSNILRLVAAFSIAALVLGGFAKFMAQGKKNFESVVRVEELTWIGSNGEIRPNIQAKDLSANQLFKKPCCQGLYRFDIHDAVYKLRAANPNGIPAIYFPAVGCGTTAHVNGISFDLRDSGFSSVGPVIPISIMDSAAKIGLPQVDVHLNCERGFLAGFWRGLPMVGDFATLNKIQQADRRFQIYMPVTSALLFVVFAAAFGVVYLATEKTFFHYRDVSINFALGSIFLLFLAGVPRAWSFSFGTALHMPVSILTSLGMFFVLNAYVEIFGERRLSKRARSFTIAVMLLLFVVGVFCERSGEYKAMFFVTSLGLVGGFWPIVFWPLGKIKFKSIGFIAFAVSVITAIGAILDAIKLSMEPYGGLPLPFFNRLTITLFMTVTVVIFLQHFINLYKEYKTVTLKAVKAGAVGRAIQMIAHDVRKPFTTLRYGLASVQRKLDDPIKAQETLEHLTGEIHKQLARVNSMLQDVMNFGATTQLMLSDVSAESLISEVYDEIIKAYPNDIARISVETTPDLIINVDEPKIFRSFYNVIENAIQASHPQGHVTIKLTSVKKSVKIDIHNTGSFVPKEKRERLFEDFYTEGKVGGTGLGLAVSKEIIVAHNGSIVCTSHPKEGTEFSIVIPLHQSPPMGAAL